MFVMKEHNFPWFYSIITCTLQERYTKCLTASLRPTIFSQQHEQLCAVTRNKGQNINFQTRTVQPHSNIKLLQFKINLQQKSLERFVMSIDVANEFQLNNWLFNGITIK